MHMSSPEQDNHHEVGVAVGMAIAVGGFLVKMAAEKINLPPVETISTAVGIGGVTKMAYHSVRSYTQGTQSPDTPQ